MRHWEYSQGLVVALKKALSRVQDAVRQICIKISERAPEFGIGTLLPELLQDTSNWDILLIGLRSLIAILLNAPAHHKATQASYDNEVLLLCDATPTEQR